MAIEVEGIDVALLRSEIQRTYAGVSNTPDMEFMFPTGRTWAQDLELPARPARAGPGGLVRVVRRRRKPVLARCP